MHTQARKFFDRERLGSTPGRKKSVRSKKQKKLGAESGDESSVGGVSSANEGE
jgi:hypothetical protein